MRELADDKLAERAKVHLGEHPVDELHDLIAAVRRNRRHFQGIAKDEYDAADQSRRKKDAEYDQQRTCFLCFHNTPLYITLNPYYSTVTPPGQALADRRGRWYNNFYTYIQKRGSPL